MNVTAEEIKTLIEETGALIEGESIVDDVALTDQGVDSLDLINIYLAIEERYGIKIPDNDLDQVRSVADIVAYIQTKLEGQNG